MVNLEELKEAVPDRETNDSVGTTTLRLDSEPVNDLKESVGVAQNKQVAPLVEALIYEAVDNEDKAEEARERFTEQFE